jgi:hypothetical protein
MSGRLRIECNGLIGHKTRVFYVEDIHDDETDEIVERETEISDICTGLDVKIRVSEANTAVLYGLVAGGNLNVELEQFVVEKLRPITVKDKPVDDA